MEGALHYGKACEILKTFSRVVLDMEAIYLCSTYIYIYINRIIESLELEWTFKGHLVQLPCNEQGHPPCLESLQGWGIHNISG